MPVYAPLALLKCESFLSAQPPHAFTPHPDAFVLQGPVDQAIARLRKVPAQPMGRHEQFCITLLTITPALA